MLVSFRETPPIPSIHVLSCHQAQYFSSFIFFTYSHFFSVTWVSRRYDFPVWQVAETAHAQPLRPIGAVCQSGIRLICRTLGISMYHLPQLACHPPFLSRRNRCVSAVDSKQPSICDLRSLLLPSSSTIHPCCTAVLISPTTSSRLLGKLIDLINHARSRYPAVALPYALLPGEWRCLVRIAKSCILRI
jgi:hypothetical protein